MMALDGLELPNIFPHGRATDSGGGRERIGQSAIIVSLDGSGDFDSIQEAINALPTGGGEIFVKEGTYIILSDILLNKANITLEGSGKSTIIKSGASSVSFLVDFRELDGVVRSIFFDQTAFGGSEFIGAQVGDTNGLLENCWFENGGNSAIRLGGAGSNNMVRDNRITAHEIQVSGTNNSAERNTVSGAANGINIKGGDNNIIKGNFCDGNTSAGITAVDAANRNIIIGNQTLNNGTHGILIAAAAETRNIVTENVATGNTTAQITDNGTSTVVANNQTA